MREKGFNIRISESLEALCAQSNLIVTNTPATQPLLFADWIKPGTLITAVGSDGAGKQELDANIYANTDVAVVDSIPQCVLLGESHYAIQAGLIEESALVELGSIIAGEVAGRQDDDQIIVADLTGVAVQDIQIAKSVLLNLE